MYTKTFEADTLDEALKAVKFELGPDAIILKTITNKGLKGAFKKKRIEITAAIPERTYEKKARVDHVLNPEQKEQFYNSPADHVAKSIDKFNNKGQQEETLNFGYGSMGLNRAVKKTTTALKSSLDDFLTDDSGDDAYVESVDFAEEMAPVRRTQAARTQTAIPAQQAQAYQVPAQQQMAAAPAERKNVLPSQEERELKREVQLQYLKIEKLEEKINDLANLVSDRKKEAQAGLTQLRTTLKTLDISERLVSHIIKRASFELTPQDLQNPDIVFDFALREIEASITCAAPLFAQQDKTQTAVVTILISEAACGQSSMAYKMACMKKDCTLIQLGQNDSIGADSLATKMFKLQVAKVNSLTELITECRKCVELGRSVFVDFRNQSALTDETMKFIEGMKRAFSNIEVLVTISAIHTELYNKKMISKFRDIAHGVVVSHLDLCLNYGSLLNVHVGPMFERVENKNTYGNNASRLIHKEKLPLKFFGTGSIIPDDIEPASPERIIAGMFEL